MKHGDEITRYIEPELVEAYEQHCLALGIQQPPRLVCDRRVATAACEVANYEEIFIGTDFFSLSLSEQLDTLSHELFHIHEYTLFYKPGLGINMLSPMANREAKADAFAAATTTRQTTRDRLQHNAAMRVAELNDVCENYPEHSNSVLFARKAEARYVADHGNDASRQRKITRLSNQKATGWAQDVIAARNEALQQPETEGPELY